MPDKKHNLALVILIFFLILNGGVWFKVFFDQPNRGPTLHFLDVGQGDATLVDFSSEVRILVDAGPDSKILRALQEAGVKNKYIDLGIISHPQLDHFNGFNYLLDRYDFGAFILNGREADVSEWQELIKKIKSKNIPILVLASEDRIRYQENRVDFFSPDQKLVQSAELNDTSFVNLVTTEKFKVLLAGDIGANVEKYLTEKLGGAFQAHILKVPHHGSKYSSSEEFLRAAEPKVAVVEVGMNRYGHPTPEVLKRLSDLGVRIFRTDEEGSIRVKSDDEKLLFF